MIVGGDRWIPSLIKPKNGGSGTGSEIEDIDVLIDSEERGDVRRAESMELRGVWLLVEPFDCARFGRVKCADGEVGVFEEDDLIVGDATGESCFGECMGVLGRDGA